MDSFEINFNMDIIHTHARFYDDKNDRVVVVESFCGREFTMMVGYDLKGLIQVGTISAESAEELNSKLKNLYSLELSESEENIELAI